MKKEGERMMKFLLSVVACITLSFTLFGCGGGGGSANNNLGTALDSKFVGTYNGSWNGSGFFTQWRMHLNQNGVILGHVSYVDNSQNSATASITFSGSVDESSGVFTAKGVYVNGGIASGGNAIPHNISITGAINTTTGAIVDGAWADLTDTTKSGSFIGGKDTSSTTRFTDKGNGTIYDSVSNLVWLKNANCFGAANWNDATAATIALASGLKCSLTDGSAPNDWRLPTVNDMQFFIDFGYLYNSINPSLPFLNVQGDYYWTNLLNGFNVDQNLSANMATGSFDFINLTSTVYVWPVRDLRPGE
jgi:hypothetical protein